MTAPPTPASAQRPAPSVTARVIELLEHDFGRRPPPDGALANMVLLDALDRGEDSRFVVWPPGDPVGLVYVSPAGTLIPAGDPAAAKPLAEATERDPWRILVGDAPLSQALLDSYARALFRRRPAARQQRLMAVTEQARTTPPPQGLRRARSADLERLTELACRLHVEDLMGPPISRSSRPAVRSRMAESVARGLTWVVERDLQVVAKIDLSLRSRRRGAQIAGVYVDEAYRGRGIAGDAVGALARQLLAGGLPGATLHVRADNVSAIAAYRRAGLVDRGTWILALR